MKPHEIFKNNIDVTKVNKILAVIDVKKMIPVKTGLFTFIDITTVLDSDYKSLLIKEYQFVKSIRTEIVSAADEIYDKKVNQGINIRFGVDFSKPEIVCNDYIVI